MSLQGTRNFKLYKLWSQPIGDQKLGVRIMIKNTIRKKDFQFYLIHAQKVILCKSNSFHFIADPYPASQNLNVTNLSPTIYRLFATPFWASWPPLKASTAPPRLNCEIQQLRDFDVNDNTVLQHYGGPCNAGTIKRRITLLSIPKQSTWQNRIVPKLLLKLNS